MGLFWLSVAIMVAAVFVIAALYDRRSRRRGHESLDGAARWAYVRERIRDARAYDSQPGIVQDVSWMTDFRPDVSSNGHHGHSGVGR